MGRGDRNTPFLLFGGLVDLIEGDPVGPALIGKTPGNGDGEGCLPVIYVSDGSYVHMGFRPFKLFLSHRGPPLLFFLYFSLNFHRYGGARGDNGRIPW